MVRGNGVFVGQDARSVSTSRSIFLIKEHIKICFAAVSILTYSYVFLTESPCTEFQFSSTGGISESQPAVIGRYILTSRTENERAIYEHANGGLFLFKCSE